MPQVVLVTGASTGLGLAIARALLKHTDMRLALTARSSSLGRFAEHGLEASDRIKLCALDVVCPQQRAAVVRELEQDWGGVDILINNAGVSYRSVVEHVSEAERLEQMDINFRSPMELTRLVLPSMRARRRGRIINISSVGGMMAMPTMAVYSASKFALEGASEALWYEVRPWNIHVTLVEPGFIRSSSFKRIRHTTLSRDAVLHDNDHYHAHYQNMEPFIERMMTLTWATPERIAARVVRLIRMRRPPLRLHATPDAWLFSLLRRFLPRRFYHWFLYVNLPRVRRWGPRGAAIPDSVQDHQHSL